MKVNARGVVLNMMATLGKITMKADVVVSTAGHFVEATQRQGVWVIPAHTSSTDVRMFAIFF